MAARLVGISDGAAIGGVCWQSDELARVAVKHIAVKHHQNDTNNFTKGFFGFV